MRIITISRMFGSGGSEIAARVATALGWTLLDNALIDRVAEQLGTTRAVVAAREERVPSLVERLASAMTLGTPEYVPAVVATDAPPLPLPLDEERLVSVTRQVVERAIADAPAVVVGRGAQAMLASRRDALHVFCYAPIAALSERVMAREGVSAEEAGRRVEETHRQREQYVRRHWQRSWQAHENYHLCVNSAWLGIDGAADAILRLARARLDR